MRVRIIRELLGAGLKDLQIIAPYPGQNLDPEHYYRALDTHNNRLGELDRRISGLTVHRDRLQEMIGGR
ncbi:hypothetical protein NOGI109294_24085 [Nocardiopsis gilva]|uniref:hypothetical protein n=1 Tax=Nocardiopsis gilva TaxID=280236 RepID=UPI000347CF63|nr:hypothetical protein [Nocardiopsis gilva]